MDDIDLLNHREEVGGHRFRYKICKYNKGNKTNQSQPNEEGVYELTFDTTQIR